MQDRQVGQVVPMGAGLSISGPTAWIVSTLLIWILGMFIWLIPGPWRTQRKER